MYCPVQFIEVAEKNCTLGSLDQEFDQNYKKNDGLLCRVGDIFSPTCSDELSI
jgi:hypothetical protein